MIFVFSVLVDPNGKVSLETSTKDNLVKDKASPVDCGIIQSRTEKQHY